MSLKYLTGKKHVISTGKSPQWDTFISAHNDSERVRLVFEKVAAHNKYLVLLPEYGYDASTFPTQENLISLDSYNEGELIVELIERIGLEKIKNGRLCIDITGFMRPHILFLVHYLGEMGIAIFDMIYTEPDQYGRKEDTEFSQTITEVRQVCGYEGSHVDETKNDILIVGVGYDDALISRVSNDKDGAKLIQLLSLPSLSADMYQESILRLDKASLASETTSEDRVFFAPANDPFMVALELSTKVQQLRSQGEIDNIYLSPLATKPQALGFAIFYKNEMLDDQASIIFPFSTSYSKETSTGVGRTWVYEIRIPSKDAQPHFPLPNSHH